MTFKENYVFYASAAHQRTRRHGAPAVSRTTIAAAAMMMCAGCVWAQENGPNAAVAPVLIAAADVGPDPAATQPLSETIQTVLVSTRRRVESSQSVPTPMTVLNGDELEANRVYRAQDLQQLLPSTTINYVHARQMSFAVRGLGNNPASDGLEGSVGLYLDNVYLARPGMAAFDALDIEQLELLRGPQGTLFGKNTTAGVVNISSRKPTQNVESQAEISAGSFGYVQGKLVLNRPVTDDLAARLSVYRTQDDGYIRNRYNGTRVQGGLRQGLRAQALYEPGKDFSLRVIADYNEEDSNNGTLIFYNAGATGKYLAQAALVGGHPVTNPEDRAVNLDNGSHVNVHQGGVSAEANWNLANASRITSISAWRYWNFVPHNDDGLDVPVTLNVGQSAKHRQFTQELRWASAPGAVDTVAGAYYYYQELENNAFTVNGPLADRFNGNPVGAWNDVTSNSPGTLRVNSYALFGQATWHATDRWDLTAGLRGTYEDKRVRVIRYAPVGPTVAGPALTVRNARYGAYDSGPLALHQSSPSALLSAGYKAWDDVLLYASLSHGEKSGGINLQVPGAAGAASLLVGAERANAAELGVKSTLLNRRLQLNANLFATVVHGYQSNAYDPTTRTSYLTNAGDVRTRGIELEALAIPVRTLHIQANVSFNDPRYLTYKNAPCAPEVNAVSCDLSGRDALVNAPRRTANIGARWEHPLDDTWRAYVNGNVSYRSSTYGTLDASKYSRIPAYGLANLSAGVRSNGEHAWDVQLWARNLFDRQYYTSMWNGTFGSYNAVIGTPRTIGATARLDF
jgi:iron complex outermembrane receptor protein